jgi:protein YIPF6
LLLSSTLSFTAPSSSASLVFAAVFVIAWCGAAMVTVNAQLLGGSISFFQSVCILGYCVFPLTISAIVCLIIGLIYKQVTLLDDISLTLTISSLSKLSLSQLDLFGVLEVCLSHLTLLIFFDSLSPSTHPPTASVVFMNQVICEERRMLAVYPVFFFYTFIAWMILLQ